MTDKEIKLANSSLDVLAGIVPDEVLPKVMLIREMINTTNLKDGYVLLNNGQTCKATKLTEQLITNSHAQGNWFATGQEANKESERRIVMQKLRGFAIHGAVDWAEEVFSLYYNTNSETWEYGQVVDIFRPSSPYFTKEGGRTALDSLREELDILL